LEKELSLTQTERMKQYAIHSTSDKIIYPYGDSNTWNWSINIHEIDNDPNLKNLSVIWCEHHIGEEADWISSVYTEEGLVPGSWNNNTWYFGGNHTFHFNKFNDIAIFWIVWG